MSASSAAVAVPEEVEASGAAPVCCPACAEGFHDQPGGGPCECCCHGPWLATGAVVSRRAEKPRKAA